MKNIRLILATLFVFLIFTACEDFMNPESEMVLLEEKAFDDFSEFRSANLGLYAIQQDLVEQLVVLGELRADLLTVTENDDPDLYEIENFNVTKENKYASPQSFYLLISNCNRLIERIKGVKPNVVEKNISDINNYDRLYGEAVCMRSWAYFNLARIYNEVPVYFEEIECETSISDARFWSFDELTDTLISQLEELNIVGMNYSISDDSWESITWRDYSKKYLLGQIYLFKGNLEKAEYNFNTLILEGIKDNQKFNVDGTFSYASWGTIFEDLEEKEYVFGIPFSKDDKQESNFQNLFVNDYLLKPSRVINYLWETQWLRGWEKEADLDERITQYRVDYRKYFSAYQGLEDTLVLKLAPLSPVYTSDNPFPLYRSTSAHLYMAEIFAHTQRTISTRQILNGGPGNVAVDKYAGYSGHIGVRYRMGLEEKVPIFPKHKIYDPYTHEMIKQITIDSDTAVMMYEEYIIEERALELAFEGERFYDLIRIAEYRNDPSFLADKVAAKFSKEKREEIRTLLMDKKNWYIPFPR